MKRPPLPQGSRRLRKLPRTIWRLAGDNWWPLVQIMFGSFIVVLLLGVKLLALTHYRLSAEEQIYAQHLLHNDLGLKAILRNPVNLPFQLLIYLYEKLHITSLLALRCIGVFFGAVSIAAFYILLKNWHTRRVAILGTLLFAGSAWTLHISRLATPEVLLMLPIVLLLCATWLEVSHHRKWTLLLCLLISLLLMYVPGMAPFVFLGIVWQTKRIYRELRHTSLWFSISWILLGLLLLLPLVWMAVTAPHNALTWIGLPAHLPRPKEYAVNLLNVPVHLLAHGPKDPVRWLGRIPLLDIFSGLMFVIGAYAYAFRFRLDRTKLLAGIFIAGSLVIALGGGVTITFLVPFAYIVIAGGISLMLQQWSTVFPRNPFAKTLATTVMSTVVLLAVFYNLNHYFIAWPNAPETHQVFTKQ